LERQSSNGKTIKDRQTTNANIIPTHRGRTGAVSTSGDKPWRFSRSVSPISGQCCRAKSQIIGRFERRLMAKTGRPRKDPKDRITQFGMTFAEMEAIEAIADEKNRSVSQIMRAAGITALIYPQLLDEALDNLDIMSNATITKVSI